VVYDPSVSETREEEGNIEVSEEVKSLVLEESPMVVSVVVCISKRVSSEVVRPDEAYSEFRVVIPVVVEKDSKVEIPKEEEVDSAV
jgi:hypothetical protein